MPQPPPATTGMPLAEVDTPALLIDLDAFERNLAAHGRLRARCRRAPAPALQDAQVARSWPRRQIALGAVGVCCQKVSEAEVMVAGGVGDVLVSNEVAGARKLDRLAALARRAKIGVCVDDAERRRRDRGGCGARRARARRAGGDRRRRPALRHRSRASRRRGSRSASRARRICALPACRPITARPSTCARRASAARTSRARWST